MIVVGLKRKLALAAVATMVALGLGEGLARLLLPLPRSVEVLPTDARARLRDEASTRTAATSHRWLGEPAYVHLATGMRYRANVHMRIRDHETCACDVEFRTNQYGFRGPPVATTKSHPRVLFLGDSITAADYLDEADTFVRLVEQFSRDAGRPVECINAAVASSGLRDQLAIFTETGVLVEPDVVVLGFYLNDFWTSPGVWIRSPPPLLRRSRLAHHVYDQLRGRSSPVEAEQYAAATLERWRDDLEHSWPPRRGDFATEPEAFNALILDAFRDWGGAWSEGIWREVLEPLLTELVRQSSAHHARLVVVAFPVSAQVSATYLYDFPQRRLGRFLRSMDVPYLDLLPLLRRARTADPAPLFYDHCHHTPRGSRVVAQAIWPFLAKETLGTSADTVGE